MRSEGVFLQHRMSLPTRSVRPTAITGGYESSSDSDYDDRQFQLPTSQSHPLGIQGLGIDQGRKRAQSLMSPTLSGSQTPSREGSGSDLRRMNGMPKSPLGSPHVSRNPSNATRSPRSGHASRAPSQSHRLPFPRAEGISAASSRHPSTRIKEESGPSRSASSRVREAERQRPPTPDKGKQKAPEERKGGLAASLGLNPESKDLTLSLDQIHDLLNDTDLASAVRMINSNNIVATLRPALGRPSSSFSTSTSRPRSTTPTSTPRPEPYIVSAPPPLTEQDHRRDRTISVSSSNGPQLTPRTARGSFKETNAERRRRMSSAAGLEPEEGHLPFTHHLPAPIAVEDEMSDGSESMEDNASVPVENGTIQRSGSMTVKTATATPEKKSRLGSLFGLKRKKSPAPPSKPPDTGHLRFEENHIKDQAVKEREEEMRRRERERREAEIAQERRFKALTQVAAHPGAERMAYKTGSHLRAYYNHVYDGLEDPPRLNPLAVLRWKERSTAQREAKEKWEAQQKKHASSPSRQIYSGAVHSSPVSVDSLSRGNRESFESAPHTSFESSLRASPMNSKSRQDVEHQAAQAWRYTVEDIEAYKEADGVVNYFIPPRPTILIQDEAASEKSSRPDESSHASSSKKGPRTEVRIGSPSDVSLIDDHLSHISNSPLSRSTSIDHAQRRDHRTHRSHQSLGTVGTGSIGQALRAPLDMINRRQRTSPAPVDHQDLRDDHSFRTKASQPQRSFFPTSSTVQNAKDILRRTHQSQMSLTDDEHPSNFNIRRLFVKGAARDDRERSISVPPPDSKQAMLQELDARLQRETTFRKRQAERARIQTELEVETQARIDQVETEIYAARRAHVQAAKERLANTDGALGDVNDAMTHYINQAERLREGTRNVAGVETTWPQLESLRAVYVRRRTISEGYGESQDVLSPLRDSESADRSTLRQRPRRKNTLSTALPALYQPSTVNTWTRSSHSAFDRLESAIETAAYIQRQMVQERHRALATLHGYINQIDALNRQRDNVRAWTKEVLEKNRNLVSRLESLRRQARGSRARMGRFKDRLYDGAARSVAAPLVRSFFGIFVAVQYILLRPFTSGLRSPFVRYPIGSTVVMSGLVCLLAYFYYIGG